jgi:hypothetical protein
MAADNVAAAITLIATPPVFATVVFAHSVERVPCCGARRGSDAWSYRDGHPRSRCRPVTTPSGRGDGYQGLAIT